MGRKFSKVARELGACVPTVSKRCRRFAQQSCQAFETECVPASPRRTVRHFVIAYRCCEERPVTGTTRRCIETGSSQLWIRAHAPTPEPLQIDTFTSQCPPDSKPK